MSKASGPQTAAVLPADDEKPATQTTKIERATLSDRLLFLLSRAAAIETTLEEARTRTYPPTMAVPDHAVDPEQAEFLFKGQREDSTHTDDKVKQLLTLSSSLATVILVFARDVRPRWMVVLLLSLLVCTVFLCVSVLDVRTFQVPKLEDATNKESKSVWAKDLMLSLAANRARHDFRVDRYRAAARYFRAALLLTPVAAAFTVARPDPADKLQASLDKIEATLTRTRSDIDTLAARGIVVRPTGPVVVTPAPGSTWNQTRASQRPIPDSPDAGRSPLAEIGATKRLKKPE